MAGRSHTTRTPHRMNEAIGRDALGFVARQNVANADFRKAIYVRPLGKGFHQVRNPVSGEEYTVSDGLGGATVEPGATVGLLSYHGMPGETLATRAPAGFGGSATSSVTRTPRIEPLADPGGGDGVLSYRGWSYGCDGSSSVLVAAFLYKSGPSTVEIRVGEIDADSIVGDDINFRGDSDAGEIGTELFTSEPIEIGESEFDDKLHRTLAVVAADGVTFVVHTDSLASGDYVVSCFDGSGALLGSDTFAGRTPPSSLMERLVSLNQHSAVVSDGLFYFAHPIGSGSQEFRFCIRDPSDASVVAYADVDFELTDHSYAGMTPLPGGGVRVWSRYDLGGSAGYGEFRDFDASMVCALGAQATVWQFVSPGDQYKLNTDGVGGTAVLGNVTMAMETLRPTTEYVLIGTHSTGPTLVAFDLDSSTAFVSANATDPEMDGKVQPAFPCHDNGFILSSEDDGSTGQGVLNRILSDGTKA